MTVEHVEFLVEEYSAEEVLRRILPGILGAVSFDVHPFQGKQDLLAKLPERLRAYRRSLPESYRVVVLVDRDGEDCRTLKARLEQVASEAGMRTRTGSDDGVYVLVNRLAIEEREAWFFGDWNAVRAAFPRVSATLPAKAGFRDADATAGGTWEALERVLQKAGYFQGGLEKLATARAVAGHMVPAQNTSRSFQVFYQAVVEMVGTSA